MDDLPPLPPYPALPMRSEDRLLWNEWAREYARLAVEAERSWRPIESAPQDGTDILVMYMHIDTQIVHAAFWMGPEDCRDAAEIGWWSYDMSEVSRVLLNDWMTPTHWKPLPDPPKEQ